MVGLMGWTSDSKSLSPHREPRSQELCKLCGIPEVRHLRGVGRAVFFFEVHREGVVWRGPFLVQERGKRVLVVVLKHSHYRKA